MIDVAPNWHPVFVHFSVALLNVAVGLFLIAVLVKVRDVSNKWYDNLMMIAYSHFGLGILFMLITLISGFVAYYSVYASVSDKEQVIMALNDHRLWALMATVTFLSSLAMLVLRYAYTRTMHPLVLLVMVVAVILLDIAAYKGGHLVFSHGVGVSLTPSSQ